jgi:hypothetical protein
MQMAQKLTPEELAVFEAEEERRFLERMRRLAHSSLFWPK